jgi:hypothetical protein
MKINFFLIEVVLFTIVGILCIYVFYLRKMMKYKTEAEVSKAKTKIYKESIKRNEQYLKKSYEEKQN